MCNHTKAFFVALYSNTIIGLLDIGVFCFLLFQSFFVNLLSTTLHLPSLALLIERLGAELSVHGLRLALFYFASHGIVKLTLSTVLWRGKLSAYPPAIGFFGLFTLSQLIVLPEHHTTIDIFLLCVNAAVCFFVAREYRILRKAVLY